LSSKKEEASQKKNLSKKKGEKGEKNKKIIKMVD